MRTTIRRLIVIAILVASLLGLGGSAANATSWFCVNLHLTGSKTPLCLPVFGQA